MDANTKLSRDVKAEIARQGIKKLELAKQIGVSPSGLSNVLNGRKRMLTEGAERILEELGLELVVQPKPKP